MTAPRDAWAALDLAPTRETRDIRRAYARALKQIDVDAEPERFAALRSAFEEAIFLAGQEQFPEPVHGPNPAETSLDDERWQPAPPATVHVIEAETSPHPEPAEQAAPDPPLAAPNPSPGPWLQAAIDNANEHAQALEAMLMAEQGKDIVPLPAEVTTMRTHWQAVTQDPRMEELGHFAAVEAWIAEILALGWPFSEPLMPDVAQFFGWMEKSDMIGQSRAVHFIARRLVLSDFVATVSNRKHPLFQAWRELTTPAHEGSRRGIGVNRKNVATLLGRIRADYPELETRFDSWRVGLWENEKHNGKTAGLIFIILVAIQLLRIVVSAQDDRPSAPPPVHLEQKLADPRADIDAALADVTGNYLPLATVAVENPDFNSDLKHIWEKVRADEGNTQDLRNKIQASFAPRLASVFSNADLLRLRRYFESQVEIASFYRQQGGTICDGYFLGQRGARVRLPEAVAERQRQAIYDILLYSGADRPASKPTTTFRIPETLIKSAAGSAKLDRPAFLDAMNGRGSADQRCNARIALISEALKLPPKQALPLLRVM